MQSAAEIAWLIPLLPLLGAIASGLGLIVFNQAMNRLKKPVAISLLTCVGASAFLSYLVLFGYSLTVIFDPSVKILGYVFPNITVFNFLKNF